MGELLDGDALVRHHLKRALEGEREVSQARRHASAGSDDYARRASEKEAYQKALASKAREGGVRDWAKSRAGGGALMRGAVVQRAGWLGRGWGAWIVRLD